MKVIEHILKAKNPLFSYEIVPPPRGRTVQDIIDIVKKLADYEPPWIDVTSHSAGAYYNELPDGSVQRRIYKKRPGTIGICGIIQNRFKIDTVTHLLTQGFTKEETEDALIEMNFLGIHNVLALRGDGLNYRKKIHANRSTNKYAKDLVAQLSDMREGQFMDNISDARPLDFGVGVAGYPEKHFEAPNMKVDIKYLKEKVDAGADYITTQMFFDNEKYFSYVDSCRKAGINVPIIPGIKILKSVRQLTTVPQKFYIDIPEPLSDEILENPSHAEEVGIRWAIAQSEELLNKGAPGVHFYIINDTDLVTQVVDHLKK
jgi:methylenetetrahydrofolate reductase (NADPH)